MPISVQYSLTAVSIETVAPTAQISAYSRWKCQRRQKPFFITDD